MLVYQSTIWPSLRENNLSSPVARSIYFPSFFPSAYLSWGENMNLYSTINIIRTISKIYLIIPQNVPRRLANIITHVL